MGNCSSRGINSKLIEESLKITGPFGLYN